MGLQRKVGVPSMKRRRQPASFSTKRHRGRLALTAYSLTALYNIYDASDKFLMVMARYIASDDATMGEILEAMCGFASCIYDEAAAGLGIVDLVPDTTGDEGR